jgi:hypothetical protein
MLARAVRAAHPALAATAGLPFAARAVAPRLADGIAAAAAPRSAARAPAALGGAGAPERRMGVLDWLRSKAETTQTDAKSKKRGASMRAELRKAPLWSGGCRLGLLGAI